MTESILESIKLLLGLTKEQDYFDNQLIMHINTVIAVLRQIGVADDKEFYVTGYDESWDDYIEGNKDLDAVKSYIAHKVRIMWDPPSGAAKEATDNIISELEWRLSVMVDPK